VSKKVGRDIRQDLTGVLLEFSNESSVSQYLAQQRTRFSGISNEAGAGRKRRRTLEAVATGNGWQAFGN
jgi:hypothetical protein